MLKSLNTNCYGKGPKQGPQIGGFRRVMNAGDHLGVNYACGGSNQITTTWVFSSYY